MFEVLFVHQGKLIVGFRLFNETFYAKSLVQHAVVGDFACLNNKVSEYLYRVNDPVMGFAIKKEKFMQIMDDSFGSKLIPRIKKNYI